MTNKQKSTIEELKKTSKALFDRGLYKSHHAIENAIMVLEAVYTSSSFEKAS